MARIDTAAFSSHPADQPRCRIGGGCPMKKWLRSKIRKRFDTNRDGKASKWDGEGVNHVKILPGGVRRVSNRKLIRYLEIK